MDAIAGLSCRGYLYDRFFASAGLSFNDRRIETNIEKRDEGTDLDISAHAAVIELPALLGVEFGRKKRVSMYFEAGYVFQITKAGAAEVMRNAKYTAIYRHPEGSPTFGTGVSYNFPAR
jgi:hypothetical protein